MIDSVWMLLGQTEPPAQSIMQFDAAVSVGILLLASLAAGILADVIRIPKVTAYLLAGVAVGPSGMNAIGVDQMHELQPLTRLAMALVLLELGCAFSFVRIRPVLRHAAVLSVGEIAVTFLLVSACTSIFDFGLTGAVLLGALAIATAPATTVLVLKESNSEGPVTELAGVLVALNNIVAIVVFELLFVLMFRFSGALPGSGWQEFGWLFINLGAAISLGAIAGLGISYGCGLLNRRRWLVMVIATSILLMGICDTWNLPYMLAFLVAGVVVVNTSDFGTRAFERAGEAGWIAGRRILRRTWRGIEPTRILCCGHNGRRLYRRPQRGKDLGNPGCGRREQGSADRQTLSG